MEEILALEAGTSLDPFLAGATWGAAMDAGYELWRSCSGLQATANQHGIAVNLHCS